MKENILVVHGGAPTAVMNASLYGVIREAEKYPNIDHIYAAIGGSGGILKEHFLDLKTIEKDKIESLPHSPAQTAGASLCFTIGTFTALSWRMTTTKRTSGALRQA
jgi:6-phosphofructokinase 1